MNFKRDIETAKRFGAGMYAEDVVQEAYLKILESGKVANDGYLYFTIRSIALDLQRVNKRVRKVELNENITIDNDEYHHIEYSDIEPLMKDIHHSHKKVFYIYCNHIPNVAKMSRELNITQRTLSKSIKLCQKEVQKNLKDWEIQSQR